MYSPDTLIRVNKKAVQKYYQEVSAGKHECENCDAKAVHIIPVYNPADFVRHVEGAYNVYILCDKCYDDGYWSEETFNCAECGELFITHHSWNILYTMINGEMYCQECAGNIIDSKPLGQVLNDLRKNNAKNWVRVDNILDKELVWEEEYSNYNDFPGLISLDQIAASLETMISEQGFSDETEVVPVITHGYQFSCVLGVFV